MKMKLLDCLLLGALSGMVAATGATETTKDVSHPPSATDCDTAPCDGQGELLFRLRSQSYDEPVTRGTSARSSAETLAPDRRVQIGLQPLARPAIAVARPGQAEVRGQFSFSLPDGGVVWATEDPTLGAAELSVSGPALVAFDNGRITQPVRFYVRSNYPAFIERLELLLYRATDKDLVQPVARLDLPVGAVTQADWDGHIAPHHRYRVGDRLRYIVRAYGRDGLWDETVANTLQLVTPEDEARNSTLLRDQLEQSKGMALSVQQASTQQQLDAVFAGNGLRLQNIALHGSRVRLQGRNIAEGTALEINGQSYPLAQDGKFVAEFLVPVGQHSFALSIQGPGGKLERTLVVDVSGTYFFGTAMADVTWQRNRLRAAQPALLDASEERSILTDARLAMYLKAKYEGRYLVTAQADTTETSLDKLFNGFTDAYAQDVFRRLDPDQYYLTYGDDSTTTRDVDTQGRVYLRVDWDKNQALWGNYATGFTGTDLAQYQRSLYGAALLWRSNGTTQLGEPRTRLRAFGSEANTAQGRSELLGTGGSLYYLRHTDILPGSEVVTLESRDLSTGRTVATQQLLRGADYEIDEFQGRIILSRPLMQLAAQRGQRITRDAPLDGHEQRLVVDYEYAPSSQDQMHTAGARGKHWFGEHVALGATYVDEARAGEDYRLAGVDLSLQAGRGTYLRLEQAHSTSTSAPLFFSSNGGLRFDRLNSDAPREGSARAVEARVNLQEQGLSASDWSAGLWWRDVDAGFSTARTDSLGQQQQSHGVTLEGELAPDVRLSVQHSRAERGAATLAQTQATVEWRVDDTSSWTAELRRVQEQLGTAASTGTGTGTLGALKYSQRVTPSLELYAIGQATLDDGGGGYANNDALTAGARYDFGDTASVTAQATQGSRGNAFSLSSEYKLSAEHSVYGAYTLSTDTTQYDNPFNTGQQPGWTLGQRWRLSPQTNLFNESQYLKDPYGGSGLAHSFGMDFYPAGNWRLGYTLQHGELRSSMGKVHRNAVSLNGGRSNARTHWQSKVEWRRDTGAEQRTQWVLTNQLTHKVDESWRLAAKLNYSDTRDDLDSQASARLAEAGFGFAYRPWDSSRWGLFGRYTYVYDMSSLGQVGWDGSSTSSSAYYDQQAHVLSLEGVYRWTHHWETAMKLAQRVGKARYGRGSGAWFDSSTRFAAVQARYEVMQQWHALAEYRWLGVKDGGAKTGWLVGVDRDITKNLRIGLGYNFTDFQGDLTRVDDYRHRGWFINLVGYY